jgi:hypothetical protein
MKASIGRCSSNCWINQCAYWRIAQNPCAINVIEIEGSAVRVLSVNDTGHLRRSD